MPACWSLIEAFIRVAEAGSLTKAARAMRISQPTLSRHIQTLEEELGVSLFVRHARGLSTTDRGCELLAAAKTIDDDMQQLLRRATGLRVDPEDGTVRVSAAEPIAAHALASAYSEIRRRYPKISLEVVVDNRLSNLCRREADIAVRMLRPTQLDLVAKRLGTVEFGLYASVDYVAHFGAPQALADIDQHTFIGFDRDESWLAGISKLGLVPEQFRFRTDSILAQLQASLEGVGVALLHVSLARRYERLVRVLPELSLPNMGIWLVVHRDVRGDPTVKAVYAGLEKELRVYLAGSESESTLA